LISVSFGDESIEDEDVKDFNKRNWLALIHLSGLLPLFFPTIIIWNRKRLKSKNNRPLYSVISFQLTNLLVIIGGIWISM